MSLQADFEAFLKDIEPSKTTVDQISSAHIALRKYLNEHADYSKHCIKTYLSGSYAKHTAIRPVSEEGKRDVDIIVETDYSTNVNSANVIIELRDVLIERSAYSSARLQTHSVGISLANLDIDIVPLAATLDNQYIGCIDNALWDITNPKGHLKWSTDTNSEYSGKFKPIIKIMKWWRREHCPENERWPKGITLEKIIADCFPQVDGSYETLMAELMENINDWLTQEISCGNVPVVNDPSVILNNLADGYTLDDFRGFHSGVNEAVSLLSSKGSDNESWRLILGNRFPKGSNSVLGFQQKSLEAILAVPHRKQPYWPMEKRKPSIIVVAEVTFPDGTCESIRDNGATIPKECSIIYHAIRPQSLAGCSVKWQVVNTGDDAYQHGCPRGGFEPANCANGSRQESTAYEGTHFVQCFVIKYGRCVAYSKEFLINVK